MQKTMIFNADLCQRSKSIAIHVGLLFYQIILLAFRTGTTSQKNMYFVIIIDCVYVPFFPPHLTYAYWKSP